MNGIAELQEPRDRWLLQPDAMLHERRQDAPQRLSYGQPSAFEDFARQMAAYELEHTKQLNDLQKLYVFPGDDSVEGFLGDHRDLTQMLLAAILPLRRIFGDTIFALRAEADEFGWQNLYVDVIWSNGVGEVFELLDQFGEEWWFENSRQARGAITFTYRLV